MASRVLVAYATKNGSAGEICRGYWWDLLAPHTGSPEALSQEIDRLEAETPEAAGHA